MRIISKFRDYYDCIQSVGYDPDLCYIRKSEILEEKVFTSRRINGDQIFGYPTIAEFKFFIIGFCGNIFQGVEISSPNNNIKHLCYSIDDVDKVVNLINNKVLTNHYYYGKNKYKYYVDRFDSFLRKNMIKFFSSEYLQDPQSTERLHYYKEMNVKNINNLKQVFTDKEVPCFVVYHEPHREQILELNPCLSDYGFQKVKDPYTAYQEIAQYISGVIGIKSPETIDISDEDKLWEKGFDNWSFKKLPTKK